MKRKSWPHSASTSSSLLQVGFWGPNCCIIGHVVMRSEQFHFSFATVDDKNHVVNCNWSFSNVGTQNDFGNSIWHMAGKKLNFQHFENFSATTNTILREIDSLYLKTCLWSSLGSWECNGIIRYWGPPNKACCCSHFIRAKIIFQPEKLPKISWN